MNANQNLLSVSAVSVGDASFSNSRSLVQTWALCVRCTTSQNAAQLMLPQSPLPPPTLQLVIPRRGKKSSVILWPIDSVIRIAWLSVSAGSGKSCIQRKIVDLCWERGVYAASFFFGPQSPKACSEERFVTAIVYQLTQTIPPLKRFVAEAIRNDETIFRKSLEVQIDRLIFDPLE